MNGLLLDDESSLHLMLKQSEMFEKVLRHMQRVLLLSSSHQSQKSNSQMLTLSDETNLSHKHEKYILSKTWLRSSKSDFVSSMNIFDALQIDSFEKNEESRSSLKMTRSISLSFFTEQKRLIQSMSGRFKWISGSLVASGGISSHTIQTIRNHFSFIDSFQMMKNSRSSKNDVLSE